MHAALVRQVCGLADEPVTTPGTSRHGSLTNSRWTRLVVSVIAPLQTNPLLQDRSASVSAPSVLLYVHRDHKDC